MSFTDTQFWSRVPASMVSTTTEVKVNRDSARVTILFKRDIGSMLRCELTLEEAKIIRRQMNVAIQAIEPPTIHGDSQKAIDDMDRAMGKAMKALGKLS